MEFHPILFGFQLCCQDLFFSIQNLIREKLLFHIFKAKPLDGIGKTLTHIALVTIQKDCFLDHVQCLILAGKDLAKCTSLRHLFSPASADLDFKSILTINDRRKTAMPDTAAAKVTFLLISYQNTIDHL